MKTTKLFVGSIRLVCGLLFAALAAISISGQGPSKNERMTTEAWDAYGKGQYDRAIEKAQECIDEFLGAADRLEKTLKSQHAPLPPTGEVSSEKEKKGIFANGPLNDVATCFYIKGRSLEATKHTEEARQAYKAAMKYAYARTWDPHGWFWSPAEGASDRLATLDR